MVTLKPGTPRWEMFGKISPKLGLIFFDICEYLRRRGIDEVVITSMIRDKEKDTGIHQLGRAIDISISNLTGDMAFDMVVFFNAKYPYDEYGKFNTMVLHRGCGYNGDVGKHIHIQVKE